jgi:hypothetical protein
MRTPVWGSSEEIQMGKGLKCWIKLKWDVRVELGVEMREQLHPCSRLVQMVEA